MSILVLHLRHSAVIIVGLLCACDAPLDPPARAFAETCQAHPHEFSLATAAIELASGRLLVIDAIEQSLIRLDFGPSSSGMVGTRGEGPLEYRAPSSLLAVADDSILMFDRPNGRFLVLDGSGAITGSVKARTDGIRLTNALRMALAARESDLQGRLYMESPAMAPDGTPDPTSALRYVLRLDRATGVVDTVAQLAGPDGYVTVGRSGNDIRMTQGFASPYLPHDGWTVTDQGSVIVSRASDYHIEFHHDDGTATVGPAIAYDASEVTQRLVEQLRDAQERLTAVSRISHDPEGDRFMSGAESSVKAPGPELGTKLPAFFGGGMLTRGDDAVWILRQSDQLRQQIFDIFDSTGHRVNRVKMPEDSRVLTLGRDHVFLSSFLPDDLQIVSRCNLPRAR